MAPKKIKAQQVMRIVPGIFIAGDARIGELVKPNLIMMNEGNCMNHATIPRMPAPTSPTTSELIYAVAR